MPDPVLLIAAAFSRHAEALDWGRRELERHFGPVGLTSLPYEFNQTRYYEPSMGSGLRKCFFAFRELVAPERLAAIKLLTNELERRLAAAGTYPEPRPLNLDPGVLSLGKFLLATTKDQAHRVYLHDGIFAEVTLRYHAGAWEPWPWTYADYRLPLVHDFLQQARDFYRERLAEAKAGEGEVRR
jgi:hypothetical protein